jgi:hypothetical protein
MPTISFKPKKVTKRIISQLQDRASDVIMSRFGLTPDGTKKPWKKSVRNITLPESVFARLRTQPYLLLKNPLRIKENRQFLKN